MHAANGNKRADQAVKCASFARPDCAISAWDILRERLDGRSFARSPSLLDNLMLRQRPGISLTKFVHFMRQTFDDYNETCEINDGYVAIHPHNLGLLMLRGISSTGQFGHAKQCVINAFDTNYLMSADEMMANILHIAQNTDEELPDPALTAHEGLAPPISTFVAACRGSSSGRGHNPRRTRGGHGLSNECSASCSLNHIMSSCTSSDDALLKWTLAKHKMIIHKYGTHGGHAPANAALLCDIPLYDPPEVMSTVEECTDEYDDTE
jgi:hypothetical protein